MVGFYGAVWETYAVEVNVKDTVKGILRHTQRPGRIDTVELGLPVMQSVNGTVNLPKDFFQYAIDVGQLCSFIKSR